MGPCIYHLYMQMIDIVFAHQAEIIFGLYPTDGQIKCELHLFKEGQATIPLKRWSLRLAIIINAELLKLPLPIFVKRICLSSFCPLITLFSNDLIAFGEDLLCRNKDLFLKLILV